MNNASIMSSRTRSGYDNLFNAPALGSGREEDENGTEFRKIKKPHPATYNPGGPLSSKAREVTERESKLFARGELPLQQARIWIELYELSDPLNSGGLPEVYRSTAPERHVQDSPPPPDHELIDLDDTKADRAARRVREELESRSPLEGIEHVAFVQKHRKWSEVEVRYGKRRKVTKLPLSRAEVERIQRWPRGREGSNPFQGILSYL
jgi:hypothetical protein